MNRQTRHKNIYISTLALVALAAGGCKAKLEPAPFTTGSVLTYAVIEQVGNSQEHYQLTIRFTQEGDKLLAKFEGPTLNPTAELDLEGRPTKGLLDFAMKTGGMVDLHLLYLPTKDRRNGVVTKAGRIVKSRPYERWTAWEIMGQTGGSGARYYEVNMGVLVGWQLTFPGKEIVAKLVDSQ